MRTGRHLEGDGTIGGATHEATLHAATHAVSVDSPEGLGQHATRHATVDGGCLRVAGELQDAAVDCVQRGDECATHATAQRPSIVVDVQRAGVRAQAGDLLKEQPGPPAVWVRHKVAQSPAVAAARVALATVGVARAAVQHVSPLASRRRAAHVMRAELGVTRMLTRLRGEHVG